MTTGIIELNDAGVRVSSGKSPGSDFVESPGVAVVSRKELLLGDAALGQSRLQPIETNTLFWHRLSAEPLPLQNRQYRHHADLAYSHLLSLHEHIADCDEIIFALPGSFTRQQMSLLLGIVGQCPFDAVGLVDSAVAASAAHARAADVLHIDLQLHQCIFTHMQTDGELQRQQVDALPHCGLLTLRDRWAKAIADQFIDQSRFDPLHSATTEQSLYDQLPQWLTQFGEHGELFLEVGNKNIKMVRQQLVESVQPIYKQLINKAEQLAGANTQLLIGDRLAKLPGLLDAFTRNAPQAIQALPASAVMDGICANLDAIKRPSSQVSFIQALPVAGEIRDETPSPAVADVQAQNATHVLLGDRAWPLGNEALHVNLQSGTVSSAPMPEAQFSVHQQDGRLVLMPHQSSLIKTSAGTNHEEVIIDNCPVNTGDAIASTGAVQTLRFIEVLDR
ncbi:hypothetical protein F6455_15135 [Proteobacteria bacterium 005FR1]|nr:hypothetical protein [Proteobacteria bacterium 005FR1]